MGSETTLQIPKIDFSGVDPNSTPGTDAWNNVRAQVFQALQSYGCFDAVYDKVTPELREELFGRATKELFGLSLETKMRNTSFSILLQGYVGPKPGWAFESLGIIDAPHLEAVQRFTNLMWPQGNQSFCNMAWTYAKHMCDFEQMVRKMVLQSLGLEKYFDSHTESGYYTLRFMEYGSGMGMEPHTDMNVITIICQHQIEGLEIQTKDGDWIHVVPLPNSFTVFIGDSFQAWTNGRLQAPLHRVSRGNVKRNSIGFGLSTKDNSTVHVPKELVDEEHPLLFKPYKYGEYMGFGFSEAGMKAKDPLKSYYGSYFLKILEAGIKAKL